MKFPGLFLVFTSLFFISAPPTESAQNIAPDSVNTPEEELAGFSVPEGFVVELVASERDGIVNPVDLTFDDAGRLWTQTARMYPLDPVADIQWNDLLKLMNDPEAQRNHPSFKRILDLYQGKTKGTDQILVLSGLYGRGPVKTEVWADGLTIPMSILPYKDGVYVAQGSELFFLRDSDNDGKADERIPLLTGFGFTDTHTMAHVLIRAPGNWINFSHGALNKGEVSSFMSDVKLRMDYSKIARFSMDAKKLELVNAGLNNIWGYQLRNNGQWYGCEANDLGYSVVPMEPGTGFPGIGNERLREYQPWMPELHKFRVGGTGISGLAFPDDLSGSFPAEWKNVALLANPITSTVNAVKITRNADGTVSAEHLPDLLTSKDKWFRPVNMEFGPDGCLYIADWYNKIISHNEIPTTHPDRDKTHGRIWRIRHKSQQPRQVPDYYNIKTEDLVKGLHSPSLWEKRAAWHQISDRPVAETQKLARPLVQLASDAGQEEITRIHALWSLEGIKHYDAALLQALLQSPSDDLRREAVRSLSSFSPGTATVAAYLKNVIEDKNPMVRAQVLRTLDELGAADEAVIDILVRASKPALEGNAMGGAYERNFERFLARKALEQYPAQLAAYLNSPAAEKTSGDHLLWAIQALPGGQKETAFLKLWPRLNISRLDEPGFVFVAGMLNNKTIFETVRPIIHNENNAALYTGYALQNQAQLQSPELAVMLREPVAKLLRSRSEKDVNLALDAVGRFNIEQVRDAVIARISDQSLEETVQLALKALENNPALNKDIFTRAVRNQKLSFGIRTAALGSLAKVDKASASGIAQQWVPQLNTVQKNEFVADLSASEQGAALLVDMHEKKRLPLASFDLPAAERIRNSNKDDPRAIAIWEAVKTRYEAEKKAFRSKLSKYMAIAEKKGGDAKAGKVLFQTCLMCHKVGNEGKNIAPALDGSANRENEALLTAILDPDAAVESNYAVYRVTKKNGSTIEGYLVSKNDRGTTIAFMGGSQIFIEKNAIRSQGFLGGRSFMIKGLIDHYSDKQVADLLAYIRTLK
ncbi:PVC-type heme-binding CxxCH protein [Agriterribacter sp.]|uniref:PVC-type heme-binding CxxCH protein n=1 Tax=Agriterribacter sp. TaxID=2821509 RepID=UPI002C6BB0DB|nr:PVC-type heme-binding CxxCH protein [Agriterribacter sp.]HRP55429.1 HEAT repeat domain-containing protein [Agriterribacter sp.]